MKKLIIIFVFLAGTAAAQDKRGDMAQQKACYTQARQYVADENSTEFRKTFEQAHFDAKTQTCYVEFDTAMTSGLISISVADAFEAKTIAQCIHPLLPKPDGKLEFCGVNGHHVNSRAEFNSLLWDMIPAFEPVDAKENNP